MSNLIITGIIDGPLPGGIPKAIELYVLADIADLSMYGIEAATNGNASTGPEFTLSGSATAGDYIYVASESSGFNSFFGFNPNFTDGVANINGDDTIILFENGSIVDVFGEIGIDGTGRSWEHLDGWAYRNNGALPSSTFNASEWTFSGVDALDDDAANVNATATPPWPIASFSAGGTNGLDLSTYVRIGRYDLPVPTRTVDPPAGSELALEVSAITYNPDTNTFFVLGDEGTAIVEIDKRGQLISSMTLTAGDFADPEGLTYVGNGQFVLVEERLRQANLFTYAAGGTLSRADVQAVTLGTTVGNIGLEGVSKDPVTGGFIFVKEVDPQGIFQTTIDFGAGTASNGSPTTQDSTNLFDPALLGMTDIADVFALANSSFVSGAIANNLLVLGQEDGRLVEVDRSGNILSELVITADAGNPLSVTDHGFEGVTLDNNGLLYITSESGGGDGNHPQVWVYAPADYVFNNAAPVTVSVANGVNNLLENANTTSAIKLGNIIIGDDSLGTNTLSLLGADASNFEIIGNELFLKAGTALDFATQSSYEVTIAVDDATLGNTPDAITTFTLDITNTAGISDLIISEVAPWSSGNSSVGADWFEVTNTGANAIDITGWKVDDDSASFANASALAGVTNIAPGQSVVFVDGDANTITAFIDLWFGGTAPAGLAIGTYGGPGLGTGGDAINLFDATGSLITGVTFGSSPSTSPFSTFDNALGNPNVTNLSTVGSNGAFSVIDAGEGVILNGSPGAIAGSVSSNTTVGIAATGATGSENGPTPGEFTILRTGDTSTALDVTYSISGDGSNGTDYAAIDPTTVTIPAGQSQVKISINPIDDVIVESTESIVITLTDTANYDVATNASSATVNIEDNDTPITVSRLQITEFMYSGADGEFIEFTNIDTSSVDMTGWSFSDSGRVVGSVDLSAFGVVQPGESVILTEADAETFRTAWNLSATAKIIGGLSQNLGRSDEINLYDATGNLVDRLTYGDQDFSGTIRTQNSSGWIPADQLADQEIDADWVLSSVADAQNSYASTGGDIGNPSIYFTGVDPTIVKIHEIQGTGTASPLVNNVVTIEAIVVGDFQDGDGDISRNLRSFYVQEEDADIDGNVATSEGIFIFENGNFITDVNVGDKVQITGTVDEFFGETQIDTITNITVISSGNTLPTAANITLPTASTTESQGGTPQPDLEAFEGMLVKFTDTLTITEMFNLDRFNEIKLSQGGRPQQFTQFNDANVAGYGAYREEISARTITYDDGLSVQNAEISNLDGFGSTFSTASDIRMGDTINNLTGVLSYQWAGNASSGATWRVRSAVNGTNQFTKVNDRPVTPENVGGSLKVTGFNVLNYFKTIDLSGVSTAIGQDPRGADTTLEFDRQTDKLVTALLAIDADVLGLAELENDFLPGSSGNAIENLVNELNGVAGAGTYNWVNPGTQFVGTDAIAVGLIYKVSAVSLVGDAAILNTQAFLDPNNTGENRNRPTVAQTFRDLVTGETFTAVVNHFKSKGASGLTAGDAGNPDSDQNDGQGFWNDTRTKAAQELVTWLNTNPTGVNDSDYLLLGDYNAYAQEDPIKALESAGYVNLGAQFGSGTNTSYVFDGQTGTLDYAFASASLAAQVTGATEWGINADEADVLDYNLDFGRDVNIFDGTVPYRSSDHDPIIVGLNLASPVDPIANEIGVMVENGFFFVQLPGGDEVQLKFNNQPFASNTFGNWQILEAETVNGINQVLWQNPDLGQIGVWNADSNWNWLSSQTWPTNSFNTLEAEVTFQIDLNNDQLLGDRLTTVENQGSTTLLEGILGNYYVQAGDDLTTTPIKYLGEAFDNNLGNWQALAAETVQGVNQVLWQNLDTNQIGVWNSSADWNWISSSVFEAGSPQAIAQADIFGVNLNTVI